jgi:hypothetical protein
MVLVAIAGLLAVAGGAVIVRRRPGGAGTAAPRPTPVPSSSEPGESLAIEAELQEIVAEGRAERDHQRSLV